jgi:hypothetical protein
MKNLKLAAKIGVGFGLVIAIAIALGAKIGRASCRERVFVHV